MISADWGFGGRKPGNSPDGPGRDNTGRTASTLGPWAGRILCAGVLFALLQPGFARAGADPDIGREKYRQYCSFCHGPAGKGDGPAAKGFPVKPADHTDKAKMSKLTDAYLRKIIAEGGRGVGKSPLMPPFGSVLKPGEVEHVLAYIRSLAK